MYNFFNFLDLWQSIVEAVEDVITKFMFWLTRMIYPLIMKFYDIFELIAKHKFITNENIRQISNNIYALISVIMLFAFATKLISAIVNPDLLSDKKKGVPGTFMRAIVAVVLVGVIPFAFNFLYQVQDTVLDKAIVEKVVLGQDGKNNVEAGELMAGYALQTFLRPTFDVSDAIMAHLNMDDYTEEELLCTFIGAAYYTDESRAQGALDSAIGGIASPLGNIQNMKNLQLINEEFNYEDCLNYYRGNSTDIFDASKYDVDSPWSQWAMAGDETNRMRVCKELYVMAVNRPSSYLDIFKTCIIARYNKQDDGGKNAEPLMFDFNGLLAVIVGFFLAYEMFLFCIDITLRSIKLALLQLIAPIVISAYVFSSDILSKWLKEVVSTFVLVFVKVAAISFMIYSLTLLPDFLESSPDFEKHQLWIRLLVLIGLLQLIKQIPTIINTIFGTNIKDQGGLKGRLGEMAGVGQLAQKGLTTFGKKATGLAGAGALLAGRGALGMAKKTPGLAKMLGKGVGKAGKALSNTEGGKKVKRSLQNARARAANLGGKIASTKAGGFVADKAKRIKEAGASAKQAAKNLKGMIGQLEYTNKEGKKVKVTGMLNNLVGNARGIAKASGKAIGAGWKSTSLLGSLLDSNKAFKESPYIGAKKAIKESSKRDDRSKDVASRFTGIQKGDVDANGNVRLRDSEGKLTGQVGTMKNIAAKAVADSMILDSDTKRVVDDKIVKTAQSANISKIESDTKSLVESMKNYANTIGGEEGARITNAAEKLASNGPVKDAIDFMKGQYENTKMFENAQNLQKAMETYQSQFGNLAENVISAKSNLGEIKREAAFASSASKVADDYYQGVLKANSSDVKVTQEMELLTSDGAQFFEDALRDMKASIEISNSSNGGGGGNSPSGPTPQDQTPQGPAPQTGGGSNGDGGSGGNGGSNNQDTNNNNNAETNNGQGVVITGPVNASGQVNAEGQTTSREVDDSKTEELSEVTNAIKDAATNIGRAIDTNTEATSAGAKEIKGTMEQIHKTEKRENKARTDEVTNAIENLKKDE